ncbi:MAG TPA: outer membrane beta-barrel protein [Xanthobacteraceae bacterium]
MTQRVQPGYEPVGVRAGSWMISPSITTGMLYDSNVFAAPSGAQADLAAMIQPTLRAHTLWERNGLDLQFSSQSTLYMNHPGLNQTDVGLRGTGWIDVRHDAQILTSFQAVHLHEGVGTLSSPTGAIQPTPYDLFSGDVTYRQEFNRLTASIGTRVDSYSYGTTQAQNGSLIDQSNRDGQVYQVHGRVDYTLSPTLALFTSTDGNHRELRGTPQNPLDSSGYRALTGADIELTHLITGEFAAGYASQRFADVTVGTVAGPTYRALLSWHPTRLLDLHFKAERVVTESADTTATGVRADGVEVGADYELRRNVIFSVMGAYELEKFFDQIRTDRVSTADARLKYLLSQYGYVSLEYRFIRRDSDIPINSFDKHQVMINVTSQF